MSTSTRKTRRTFVVAVAAAVALAAFPSAGVRAQGTAAQDQAPPVSTAPAPVAMPAPAGPAEQQPGLVIRKESKLVLVDAVVTDKKGNYVHDLTQKDFKVYEDNKEQQVASFSAGSDVAIQANNAQRHYLILFFDNSSMAAPDQIQARGAASKFMDANAGPDHLMAVVDFGGTLRIVQNFTANADVLRAAVRGVKTSYVASNATPDATGAGSIASPGFPRSAAPRLILARERCCLLCAAWRKICARCPAARCWCCFRRDSRSLRKTNRSLPPRSTLATKPTWRSTLWTCAVW